MQASYREHWSAVSLADDLSKIEPGTKLKGPRCTVGVLIETLDAESAAILEAKMIDRSIPSGKIAATLLHHGHIVREHAITRHRRRANGNGCACDVTS